MEKDRRAPAEICLKHARELGKLSASYKSLLRQNGRLFELARMNEASTIEVKGILNNGLVKSINDLCEQTKRHFDEIDTKIRDLRKHHEETNGKVAAIEAGEDKGPTGFLRRSWDVFIGKCRANEWWFWPATIIFIIWVVGKIGLFAEKSEWMTALFRALTK
jgi:hypothetical protein